MYPRDFDWPDRPQPVHPREVFADALADRASAIASGHPIDSDKIKKHKLDVFRLYAMIDPDVQAEIPPQIKQDMQTFLDRMKSEDIDLKVAAGLANQSKDDVLAAIRNSFCGKS